jgi:hypothetical protein
MFDPFDFRCQTFILNKVKLEMCSLIWSPQRRSKRQLCHVVSLTWPVGFSTNPPHKSDEGQAGTGIETEASGPTPHLANQVKPPWCDDAAILWQPPIQARQRDRLMLGCKTYFFTVEL